MSQIQIPWHAPRVQVLSLVFDLYGRAAEPTAVDTVLVIGPMVGKEPGSRCCYRRVNLRALPYEDLLRSPVVLWPLVPLSKDGVTEEAVAATSEALREAPLAAGARADLLAALWFLAEAEKFPRALLNAYIGEEQIMRSELADYLVQKGLEKGREEGLQEGIQEGIQEGREEILRQTIMLLLQSRLGKVPREVQGRVLREARSPVLQRWYEAAIGVTDESAARRLMARIRAAKPVAARRGRAR